jgi:uncharacterized membrane protein YoaK (UPF0700 family)
MGYANRIFKSYDALEKRQLAGDLGLGLIVGAIICLGLHLWGLEGSLWGVSYPVLYGLAIMGGATLLSASFRLVPDIDKEVNDEHD